MKTRRFHRSNLGMFGEFVPTDSQGYVTVHVDDRYSAATEEQLDYWCNSPVPPVRAAALAESAERRLEAWREQS